MTLPRSAGLLASALLAMASCSTVYDWPMSGRDASRNAASPEKNPPTDWSAAPGKERNIAWSAALGAYTLASPIVADGLVWAASGTGLSGRPAGTDAALLQCFREADGTLLWKYESPTRKDLPVESRGFFAALRGSPLVEGDRLWLLDNRWEVLCFDIGPLQGGAGEPRLVWKTDLLEKTGAWPEIPGMGYSQGCSIGATYRGMIFVSTGNGRRWQTQKPERPDAPALICLDAGTGQILGREDSGIGARSVTGNRSSPVTARFVDPDGRDRRLVIFGGGDGFLYAFEPMPVERPDRPDLRTLREVWRVDCNREGADARREGIIATPVVHNGRVYALLGGDVFDHNASGNLSCVDLVSGRKAWNFGEVGLSTCSPVVSDGLVIVVDGQGFVNGLEESTGKLLWRHDTLASIVASPLLADGRLYVATTDEEMLIYDVRPGGAEGGSKRPAAIRRFPSTLYAAPLFARGTLYVATEKRLYAIRESTPERAPDPGDRVPRGRAPDALFVPTPPDVVERILELVDLKKTDIVYDLGSGDGRVVIAAAKYHGCRAIGIEIDRELVDRSREAIRKDKLESRVRIDHEDLLKADLTDASVVFLYVGERLNRLLTPKLKGLQAGARIVSHDFEIPGATPEHVLRVGSVEDGRDHALYLYRTPLKGMDGK